jgi:hypothetical protein
MAPSPVASLRLMEELLRDWGVQEFAEKYQDSCVLRAVGSCVAGGSDGTVTKPGASHELERAGLGMGITLGTFVGTMAGAHGQIEGKTLAEQLRRGFGKTFQTTMSRGWQVGVVSADIASCLGRRVTLPCQMFGTAGAVFSAVECGVEKWRAKHDMFNTVFGGLGAGAALGAWSAREGPASRESHTTACSDPAELETRCLSRSGRPARERWSCPVCPLCHCH